MAIRPNSNDLQRSETLLLQHCTIALIFSMKNLVIYFVRKEKIAAASGGQI